MQRFSTKSTVAALIVAVFTAYVLFTPSPAYAKWDDRSDELPGMDNSLGTYLLVGAGIVAAGTVVYLIAKSGKDDGANQKPDVTSPTSTAETTEQPAAEDDDAENQEHGTTGQLLEKQGDLKFYFDVRPEKLDNGFDDRALGVSNMTVRAGVSLGF